MVLARLPASGAAPAKRRPSHAAFVVWALLGVGSLSAPALAQEPEGEAETEEEDRLAVARRKFQAALNLKVGGDYLGASKLLREVGEVKMTPQVHYHIADCDEHLGHLVAALGGYARALELRTPDVPDAFVSEVQAAMSSLQERIPKLVLRRGEGAEAARIELDQVALGGERVGTEIPIDPGPHEIVASASGYQPYRTSVTVGERQTKTVVVNLEALPREPEPAEPISGYGPWPYVLGGAGVLGLVAGAVLLPLSQDKVGEVEAICGGSDCGSLSRPGADPELYERAVGLASDARTLEAAGWISGGVGVSLLATGVVLYFLDPTRVNEDGVALGAHSSLTPSAPGSLAGVSWIGRF